MPRNRNQILGKAWDLIALSISPMAKVKKPITRKLLLFKKTKRFKLLRHYNYAFIGEYEFSPSSTPLFRPAGGAPWKKKNKRKSSVRFLSLLCGGNYDAESVAEGGVVDDLEMLSPRADGDVLEGDMPELSEFGEEEEDDDASIDQRAERFIEKFYAEMRIQRQNSIVQYREMLLNGCE